MTELLSHTSGSADFKSFVGDALDDSVWALSDVAPSGFGIARLRRLLAFLVSALSTPASRRSAFGPTRANLLHLRERVLGITGFVGTKAVLYDSFHSEVSDLVSNWPPSAATLHTRTATPSQATGVQVGGAPPAPPVAPPNDVTDLSAGGPNTVSPSDFWSALTSSTPEPDFYPSVLLSVRRKEFHGTVEDLASLLLIEEGSFAPVGADGSMSEGEFVSMRPSVARTFSLLLGTPLPDSVPNGIARKAIHAFLLRQLHLTRARVRESSNSRPAPVPLAVERRPASFVPMPPPASAAAVAAPLRAASSLTSVSSAGMVSRLSRSFSSLVDHLQNSGVNLGDSDSMGVGEALPDYVTASLVDRNASLDCVPDVISDVMAAHDEKFLRRLDWIYSAQNIKGEVLFDDVERDMQSRFCAADMDIVGLEKSGTQASRKRVRDAKTNNHNDFRRFLEIRQQRHKLQRIAVGNALAKQEVEALKSREFAIFAQIRVRYRSMLASDSDRQQAVAAATTARDFTFVQSALRISPAQAKTYLSTIQKSRFRRPPPKRGREASAGGGPKGNPSNPKKGKHACFHCGASGKNNYHSFHNCKLFTSGAKPKQGTVHAADLAAGKALPKRNQN